MSKGKRAQYTLEFKMRSYMKRLLLGLMMLMTATAASAEWTIAGGNAAADSYVDRATIRRNGDLVKMWDLGDFKKMRTVQSYSYLSHKSQQEHDCKEEKIRTLAFLWFSGQMGNGNVVYSNSNPGEWTPISPESIGESLWKIACGKQ